MSGASSKVLDIAALNSAVSAVTRHRQISLRDVAAETGLSASTLTRIAQGQKPDADALVTLLAWLNADAAAFAVPRGDGAEEGAGARDDDALAVIPVADLGQLLAVATLYADAFRPDEMMTLPEKMRLQEVEAVLGRHGRGY